MNDAKKRDGIIRTTARLTVLALKVAPITVIAIALLSLSHAAVWALLTPAQQGFFDALEARLDGMSNSLWPGFIGLIMAFVGAQAVCLVENVCFENFFQRCTLGFGGLLNRKAATVEPVCFEDTARLDDINKAAEGAESAYIMICIAAALVFQNIGYVAFMGAYLWNLQPRLVIGLVLIFLPALFSQVMRMRLYAKLEDASAPLRRKFEYYESCVAGREYMKETRQLGAVRYFARLYKSTLALISAMKLKAKLTSALLDFFGDLLTAVGYVCVLMLSVNAMLAGDISVGAFAAVFATIGRMVSHMEYMMDDISGMSETVGKTGNFLRFLDMPERGGRLESLPDGDIELDNVSFSYPNATKKALSGVSLTLKRGETLAVVGENGSGKSTLIRLITGLYLPEAGEVRRGGVSTREASVRACAGGTSAVFQKYQRYQMTLGENVAISQEGKAATAAELDNAVGLAGFTKADEQFEGGYETMLSREFDGVDLSGGQWQRVAIARGFYRDHGIIILDEPTAAIDPLEESRIYNRFAEVSQDKTAVIVTHRLGSVKLADRIAVMKGGELVECGTHDELMASGGEYARIYESQRQWYE